MTPQQQYLQAVKKLQQAKEELKHAKEILLTEGRPFEKGDVVEITRRSGKVTGKVESFGILEDDHIYVTCVSIGSKKVYFSKPYLSIRKVEI